MAPARKETKGHYPKQEDGDGHADRIGGLRTFGTGGSATRLH